MKTLEEETEQRTARIKVYLQHNMAKVTKMVKKKRKEKKKKEKEEAKGTDPRSARS